MDILVCLRHRLQTALLRSDEARPERVQVRPATRARIDGETRGAEDSMKHGARNQLMGTVTSVKKGDITSLIKFAVAAPATMASVITTESADQPEPSRLRAAPRSSAAVS